jgi:hypothetical protein
MTRLAIITLLALAGCYGKPEEATTLSEDFTVARLFTHEGCTVYRFKDAGTPRYFTNCQGSTSWSTTQSNGKSSTKKHHEIQTEVKP